RRGRLVEAGLRRKRGLGREAGTRGLRTRSRQQRGDRGLSLGDPRRRPLAPSGPELCGSSSSPMSSEPPGGGRSRRVFAVSAPSPGRGMTVVPVENGTRLAVINVLGSLFLHPASSMFEMIDELVETALRETPLVVVDVHAEATSEKVALARWLDGKATAVFGTHTHVQTSDARVLPLGTAFITDAGMSGPHDSVIGVEVELAIRRMRTGLPVRFETARGDVRIEGALVDCDAETGRASAIEPVRVHIS